MAWTFGCRLSQKGCSCSHLEDVLLLGTDGKPQTPSARRGLANLDRACNQSPTFGTRNPSGDRRERPPPPWLRWRPDADLPFSWDLPHPWGRGWVLGWMLWPCCGWLEPPSGLLPELLSGQAAMPLRSSPVFCSGGTGSLCLLAKVSWLPFLRWGTRRERARQRGGV